MIGALQKSYGVESFGAAAFSGAGKSFFLHDLLAKVVFGEAGWVSTNMAAVRRSFILRAAAFSLIALGMAAVLGAWWVSYSRNSALIASTNRAIDGYANVAGDLIKQKSLNDPDLRPVYERVDALLNLPAGYARRDDGTPMAQRFGLNQRPRLEEASETTYQQALERLLRPRLVLRLEQQIQKNINDPSFAYEALKVYLMLGGKAPRIDKDLIVEWFARDWEENLYPGGPYKPARELLRAHLVAMLDLDAGASAKVGLNGDLVEQAQATLAHMRVADRAYTLLKSEAHGEPIEDWNAAQRGGPEMALVFAAKNGAGLDTIRVPAFFTYAGFYKALLAHMTDIADKMQKEQWVLGKAGDQTAVKDQLTSMMPDILTLYGKEFQSAWDAAIDNLTLRPMIADSPKYVALGAASAPTSPIKQIFESIRDETALTRERKGAANNADVKAEAKDDAAQKLKSRLGSVGNEALKLAMKSQRKPGDPPAEVPGASIESHFQLIQILMDGAAGQAPIDSLLANLDLLNLNLRRVAERPSEATLAGDKVKEAIGSLRANATKPIPPHLKDMMVKIADDADAKEFSTDIAQLSQAMNDQVTGACQKVTANFYPFATSTRDAPMADFARMFSPGGVIDKFFNENLTKLVNQSGKTWTWRPMPQSTRKLSDATLRQFQQAQDIRNAFFTQGNQPSITLLVKPMTLGGDAQSATLTINGVAVAAQQGTPFAPTTVQWPGAGAGAASIAILPDLPDRKSTLEFNGPWALFRLLDKGNVLPRGDTVSASFIVGAREVSYQFSATSLNNPLTLTALRQFKCPNGL